MRKEYYSLHSEFWECAKVNGQKGKGAQSLFAMLREAGGNILRSYPPSREVTEYDSFLESMVTRWVSDDNQGYQVHPEPEKEVDENGTFIVGKLFSHPSLKRSPTEDKKLEAFHPTGDITFIHESRNVDLRQTADPEKPRNENLLASGQLALGYILYPYLSPLYGWIDKAGDKTLGAKSVKRTELKYIFWANFVGPAYVQKFGRDFLLNAPGWKKEELEDGGILYVVCERFTDWLKKKPKAVLDYFRAQIPGIKLYQAKESYD